MAEICPFCMTDINPGATVCAACGARLVVNRTKLMLNGIAIVAMLFFAILVIALLTSGDILNKIMDSTTILWFGGILLVAWACRKDAKSQPLFQWER